VHPKCDRYNRCAGYSIRITRGSSNVADVRKLCFGQSDVERGHANYSPIASQQITTGRFLEGMMMYDFAPLVAATSNRVRVVYR
jgi:hypothetical protein